MTTRDGCASFRDTVYMRWLLAVLCLSFVPLSQAAFTQTIVPKGSEQKFIGGKVIDTEDIANRTIDKILVLKSAHQLQLMSNGEALKTYRISLGKAPKGPKLQEGDQRTLKASTGWTTAKPATPSTCRCTFPTPTSPIPHAPAAKA
jgi:hypothetical protein